MVATSIKKTARKKSNPDQKFLRVAGESLEPPSPPAGVVKAVKKVISAKDEIARQKSIISAARESLLGELEKAKNEGLLTNGPLQVDVGDETYKVGIETVTSATIKKSKDV